MMPQVAAPVTSATDESPDIVTEVASAKRPGPRIGQIARQRRRYEKNEIRRFTRRSRHRRALWLTVGFADSGPPRWWRWRCTRRCWRCAPSPSTARARVQASEVHSAIDGQLGTPLALVDYGAITPGAVGVPADQELRRRGRLLRTRWSCPHRRAGTVRRSIRQLVRLRRCAPSRRGHPIGFGAAGRHSAPSTSAGASTTAPSSRR